MFVYRFSRQNHSDSSYSTDGTSSALDSSNKKGCLPLSDLIRFSKAWDWKDYQEQEESHKENKLGPEWKANENKLNLK